MRPAHLIALGAAVAVLALFAGRAMFTAPAAAPVAERGGRTPARPAAPAWGSQRRERPAGQPAGQVGRDDAAAVAEAGVAVPDERRDSRDAALPQGGVGAGSDAGQRRAYDSDGQVPPAEWAPGSVLLSVPLRDGVEAAKGSGPLKAEGIVVHGDAVEFTDEAQFTLPAAGQVQGRAGTVTFDVESNWAGTDPSNRALLQIGNPNQLANQMQIVKHANTLRFRFLDGRGVESTLNVFIDQWQANERHRVSATWDEAGIALYVDGQPGGRAAVANPLVIGPQAPIHVGSAAGAYRGADARLSNLTIHGRALTPADFR